MTSGDEIISDLISEDNEYSYEENDRKAKRRIKKSSDREERMLGKKKREDTDELISEDADDRNHSIQEHTDSGVHASNSLTKQKRVRKRQKKAKYQYSSDKLDE